MNYSYPTFFASIFFTLLFVLPTTASQVPSDIPSQPSDFNTCVNDLKNLIFEQKCLIKVSSVSIGYMLMTFAIVLKLPQIIKIYNAKSTEGILELFFYIDMVNVTNVVAWFKHYNYPFNTYGDSASILIQQILLILQMWYYSTTISFTKKFLYQVLFAAQIYLMILNDHMLPDVVFDIAKSSILLFMLGSRIPQIRQNYLAKSSGKLSQITLFMLVVGQLLKLFSLYNQVTDHMAMTLVSTGFICNSILFYQSVVYGDRSAEVQQADPVVPKTKAKDD